MHDGLKEDFFVLGENKRIKETLNNMCPRDRVIYLKQSQLDRGSEEHRWKKPSTTNVTARTKWKHTAKHQDEIIRKNKNHGKILTGTNAKPSHQHQSVRHAEWTANQTERKSGASEITVSKKTTAKTKLISCA